MNGLDPTAGTAAPTEPADEAAGASLRRILLRVWNPTQPDRIMLAGENDPPGSAPLVLPDGVFDALFASARAEDGDEIEILVRRTGRRPLDR